MDSSLLGWLTFVVLFFTGIVVMLYTLETKRLREAAQRQVAVSQQQVAVSQEQIRVTQRLELYGRRAEILRGVLAALGRVVQRANVQAETIPDFLRATSEQRYLLDDDLCAYLDEIYKAVIRGYTLHLEWEDLEAGDTKRKPLVQEQNDIIRWLLAQPIELHRKFARYLEFREGREGREGLPS
jgi:hypothetical protein